jgi:poly-gamma-glutamate system protein
VSTAFSPTVRLVILACAAAGALMVCQHLFVDMENRSDGDTLKRATELADRWFRLIADERKARDVPSGVGDHVAYPGVIGAEWSEITTTLGSLDAKITAANPAFAALVVRLLHDAGIGSSSRVGVTLSGSFPSLAIATLAALQTIGAEAVIVSSVGASSFGANEPEATWPDMEMWLRQKGSLAYRSALITPGGEEDNGSGFSVEGRLLVEAAVRRAGATLTIPSGYEDALRRRMELFSTQHIDLLVNIGGNQTSLGMCGHGPTLPNGLSPVLPSCGDSARGLLVRMAERGIPVIHLLNIRSLAARYNLPLVPSRWDRSVVKPERLADGRKPVIVGLCVVLLSGLWWVRGVRVPWR